MKQIKDAGDKELSTELQDLKNVTDKIAERGNYESILNGATWGKNNALKDLLPTVEQGEEMADEQGERRGAAERDRSDSNDLGADDISGDEAPTTYNIRDVLEVGTESGKEASDQTAAAANNAVASEGKITTQEKMADGVNPTVTDEPAKGQSGKDTTLKGDGGKGLNQGDPSLAERKEQERRKEEEQDSQHGDGESGEGSVDEEETATKESKTSVTELEASRFGGEGFWR